MLNEKEILLLCSLVYLPLKISFINKPYKSLLENYIYNLDYIEKRTKGLYKRNEDYTRKIWENMILEAMNNTKISSTKIKELSLGNNKGITIVDEEENIYIIFRGTDSSLAWYDNIDFLKGALTECQSQAIEYVNRISKSKDHNKLIVAGHSKGGNNALLSCLLADNTDYAYLYFAPGIEKTLLQNIVKNKKENFKKIKSVIIHNYEPVGSIFMNYLDYIEKTNIKYINNFTKNGKIILRNHEPTTLFYDNDFKEEKYFENGILKKFTTDQSDFSIFINKICNQVDDFENQDDLINFLNALIKKFKYPSINQNDLIHKDNKNLQALSIKYILNKVVEKASQMTFPSSGA